MFASDKCTSLLLKLVKATSTTSLRNKWYDVKLKMPLKNVKPNHRKAQHEGKDTTSSMEALGLYY